VFEDVIDSFLKVPRIDSSGTFRHFSDKKSVLGGKFTVKNSKVPGTKAKTELFHPKIYVDARSLELPLLYC
jgi:hypothetical protein